MKPGVALACSLSAMLATAACSDQPKARAPVARIVAKAPPKLSLPVPTGAATTTREVDSDAVLPPSCSDRAIVRVAIDDSFSMRGFMNAKLPQAGLRDLVGNLRNELVESSQRAEHPPSGQYVFIGERKLDRIADAARKRWMAQVSGARQALRSCGQPSDCAASEVCCELPDSSGAEAASASTVCAPSISYCGALRVAGANALNVEGEYSSNLSRVNRGIRSLVDECVETAMFVTDGLETPEGLENESCAKGARSPPLSPALVRLLNSITAPSGWGLWLIAGRLPFDGTVWLECGQADAAMKRALGGRLRAGRELSFRTEGPELEPVLIFILSRAGTKSVHRIAAGLESRLADFAAHQSASEGGAWARDLSVLQVWPPPAFSPCSDVAVSLKGDEGAGQLQTPSQPIQPGRRAVQVLRVSMPPMPTGRRMYGFEPSVESIAPRLASASAAESGKYFSRLDAPGRVPTAAALTARLRVAPTNECGTLVRALVAGPAKAPDGRPSSLPWPVDAPTRVTGDFAWAPSCAIPHALQHLTASGHPPGPTGEISVDVTCVVKATDTIPQALERLQGDRWMMPADARGIPGVELLVRDIREWLRSQHLPPVIKTGRVATFSWR